MQQENSKKGKSLEAVNSGYEEYRKRQKQLEIALAAVAGGFMTVVLLVVVFFNGAFLSDAAEVIRSYEVGEAPSSRSAETICSDPKNQRSIFCQRRALKTDAEWRANNRYNAPSKGAFNMSDLPE